MSLNLMYITNQADIARIAENAGVGRIFIDLEAIGKKERQRGFDTVISQHSVNDVKKIKNVLQRAEVLVRTNPLHENSKTEINRVIDNGADIVMLPYFRTASEVGHFIDCINGRAKTCLLCETPEAVDNIDEILKLPGIDEVHIGLNDLHLGYGMKFMFELLTNGTVEYLCNKFREKGILYGFGGIARIGKGILPPENIIVEHYRLGSQMVILSRAFCDVNYIKNIDEIRNIFILGIEGIRKLEKKAAELSEVDLKANMKLIVQIVNAVTAND